MFRAHRPCDKNRTKDKSLVVLVYVFREGSWHYLVIYFGSILASLLEVFESTNGKKQVPERHDKTALKKVMRASQKVMQWSAQDYETEEVGPYNTILLCLNSAMFWSS